MKELLVPCGDIDSLKVAVFSGADAVYLGGLSYGARANAKNFSDEEVVNAIKFAHLYGVKVYVTVNTLIYESELESAYNFVLFLHKSGVDAIIMQDIGLISMTRRRLPNLVIHASTQMHNTNQSSIDYLSSLGVKRVVLARELSLESINNIKTKLEKEVFIHGALCISYSGICLFSSRALNRSGNRGLCAQVCRLPYTLMENNKEIKTCYLLSPKEFNTINNFNSLLLSDIKSFKIEGRMKSPEYVGCVTKLYRKYIDESIVDNNILNDLKVIYNRNFTNGYLFNSTDIMSTDKPNHRGIKLGKVVSIDKNYIGIKLNTIIHQGDGIRFIDSDIGFNVNYLYSKELLLINKEDADNIVYIKNTFKTYIGESVYKTYDTEVANKYRNVEEKKILIKMHFKAKKDEPISLTITDNINEVKKVSIKPERAINIATNEEQIKKQLEKLGNTPFILDSIKVDIDDNLFINIKEINEIRRNAIFELIQVRENKKIPVVEIPDKDIKQASSKYHGISVLVRTEEQMKAAIDSKITRIYTTCLELYKKFKNHNVFFREYKDYHSSNCENIIATKTGDLIQSKISDYSLNATNHETINKLRSCVDLVTLSIEVDDEELKLLSSYYKKELDVEKIIYGRVDVMTLKHCILSDDKNKNELCKLCLNKQYFLKDKHGNMYPIITNKDIHLTHILDCKPINDIDKINIYKELGITNFRLEFFNETYDECINLIKKSQ